MSVSDIGQYIELKLAMRIGEAQAIWTNLTTQERIKATTLLANYIYHEQPFPHGYIEAIGTLSETAELEALEDEAKAAIGDDDKVVFECSLPEAIKIDFGRAKWDEICARHGWDYVIEKRVIRRRCSATMLDEALRVFLWEDDTEEDTPVITTG